MDVTGVGKGVQGVLTFKRNSQPDGPRAWARRGGGGGEVEPRMGHG